jgi:hypothetical protein
MHILIVNKMLSNGLRYSEASSEETITKTSIQGMS